VGSAFGTRVRGGRWFHGRRPQPVYSWRASAAIGRIVNVEQDLDARLARVLAGRPERIAAVYAFGSVARGAARPASDLDVGVLFVEPPPATLDGLPVDLQDALTRAAGRTVDLVVLNTAPVDLVHRVLRDGRLVHETDRSRRIAFEVRSRALYFDLLPVLRQYRAARA
jgi:uncharacterized protein